jgi:hypothetical protein
LLTEENDMRAPVLAIAISVGLLTAHGVNASPPADEAPSLSDLSRAGAGEYEPMRPPDSLAKKLLAALTHPGEASSGGGGSTGSDNQHWSQSLKSSTPPSELLPAYTEQFTAAGWTVSFTQLDGPIALQGWRFTDATGQDWHALLIIEESAQQPADRRNLTLRLTRIRSDS